MVSRAAAIRYARALFEVSHKQGELERIDREVSAFVALVDGHPALGQSLLNPAVPPGPKRAVVTALLDRAGGHSETTVRLLTLLAERDRLSLLPEILESFRGQVMELQGIGRARVTTATPLTSDRAEQINQQLATATGKKVDLETGVDPSVIGGVVTQIGSIVWDGSIARHLARLRQQFSSET